MIKEILEEYVEKFDKLAEMSGLKVGPEFNFPHKYVLKHGFEYHKTESRKKYKKGAIKECFNNSLKLALTHNLVYCEGFIDTGIVPIPIHHAWCVDGNGNLIDITTNRAKSYIGVPFQLKEIVKFLDKSHTASILTEPEILGLKI